LITWYLTDLGREVWCDLDASYSWWSNTCMSRSKSIWNRHETGRSNWRAALRKWVQLTDRWCQLHFIMSICASSDACGVRCISKQGAYIGMLFYKYSPARVRAVFAFRRNLCNYFFYWFNLYKYNLLLLLLYEKAVEVELELYFM